MLTRLQNIFLATKNIEKTSKQFSSFFSKNPDFIGHSKNLGIDIIVYDISKTNICLICPKNNGFWFDSLSNFLKEKGEGIFGVNFSSDDIDKDYSNFVKNGLEVNEKNESNFESSKESQLKFSFFNIMDNSIDNLNILVSNEINFSKKGINSIDRISKVNQLVIQTEFPDSIIDIFEKKLNIRLALDKTFKEWSGRMLFFRIGGVTLEVIEGKNIKLNSEYFGIGWHTNNFNKCYNDLVEEGLKLSEIRKGRKKGTIVSTLKNPMLNIPTILIGLEE